LEENDPDLEEVLKVTREISFKAEQVPSSGSFYGFENGREGDFYCSERTSLRWPSICLEASERAGGVLIEEDKSATSDGMGIGPKR